MNNNLWNTHKSNIFNIEAHWDKETEKRINLVINAFISHGWYINEDILIKETKNNTLSIDYTYDIIDDDAKVGMRVVYSVIAGKVTKVRHLTPVIRWE